MTRLLSRREQYVYVEHGSLSPRDGQAVATTGGETTPLPLKDVASVVIGPGCRITSSWVVEAANCHVVPVWAGENGARFYASGRPSGRDTAPCGPARAGIKGNQVPTGRGPPCNPARAGIKGAGRKP